MFKNKNIFSIFASLYLVALFFFLWGVVAGNNKIFPWKQMEAVYTELNVYFNFKGESHKSIKDEVSLDKLEMQTKYNIKGYKLHDSDFEDTGYLLISRYSKELGESVIELFSISEERVVHSWIPPFEEIVAHSLKLKRGNFANNDGFKVDNNRKDKYRPLHPLLLNDGSIVFNVTQGPLVRIDACGNMIWVIDRQFHHSVELDHNGNIIAPIVVEGKKFFKLESFRDDGFAIVSLEGRIIKEQSITEILIDNGYRGLVFGVGRIRPDAIHLNDAQPMLFTSDGVDIGDIAFSMRTLSTVFLFRPRTSNVVWLKTGPWLKQHDINQLKDGKFSIFGNNVIDIIEPKFERPFIAEGRHSEIYFFNPQNNITSRPFSHMMSKHGIASATSGRLKILSNGDAFIEETDSGSCRLLRISDNSLRWEYVNSISSTTVGFLHWSRYLYSDQIDLKWMENSTCN